MIEKTNVNLEKAFFAKILNEPDQFYKVRPHFFENEQIRLIYEVVRKNYISSKDKVVPSPKQMWLMVSLVDTSKVVTKEAFKIIMNVDLSEYENEWLDSRFKSWKVSKHTRDQLKESIDLIHGMDEINYENVMDIALRLKDKFAEIDSLNNDDADLGDDFDDPESHKQNVSMRKMTSGWSNIDKILSGGWDHATLNIIMGETNIGKCSDYQTLIKIKNRKSGEIIEITIGDFYEKIKTQFT